MKAEEMFEKLGYERIKIDKWNDSIIYHKKIIGWDLDVYENYISFHKGTRNFEMKGYGLLGEEKGLLVDFEEVEAIIQQMKELGWLDD